MLIKDETKFAGYTKVLFFFILNLSDNCLVPVMRNNESFSYKPCQSFYRPLSSAVMLKD